MQILTVRCFALALLAGAGFAQNGALRGPSTAAAGSTIVVEVASSAPSVNVQVGPRHTNVVDVPASKNVAVLLPKVPPGTVIAIWVGRGNTLSLLEVTIQ